MNDQDRIETAAGNCEVLRARLARIACLEGEIAKRDETIARIEPQLNRAIQANYDLREELAACRVAVENCEVFRARIAELEADRDRIKTIADNYSALNMDAQAEFAAINGQEPVIDAPYGGILRIEAGGLPDSWVRINPCKLYAAPVSGAKAQVVVMPDRESNEDGRSHPNSWTDHAIGWNACLRAVARLNQQRSS